MSCAVHNKSHDWAPARLLGPGDGPPFEIVNGGEAVPVVLVCEHAGRKIPAALGDLGMSQAMLDAHIAWDIGAGKVARHLSQLLAATLVLQPYSRLVVDCNRPPDVTESIPPVSDGHVVPGNTDMTESGRKLRLKEIFEPFDSAVGKLLNAPGIRAAFAIHSFTPRLAGGEHRPWHIGICSRKDLQSARKIVSAIQRQEPGFEVAVNEPYRIEDRSDWFVPQYCEPRNLAHSLIEIRNDLLVTDEGCAHVAKLLAVAITEVLEVPA